MGIVIVLALSASLFYGASDFLGALSSRKLTVLKASTAVYLAATLVAAVALLIDRWHYSDVALWAGVVAGALATIGMVTFYAALAIGPMSLLAPLIALIQTAIPVVAAAATGQALRPLAWIAVVLALTATILISVPARTAVGEPAIERISLRAGILALVAGVTLGFSVVSLDVAPAESGVFPAFLDLAVGLAILLPLLAVTRFRESDSWLKGATVGPAASAQFPVPSTSRASVWIVSAAAGALLGIGNILLVLALHSGNLAVVAVLVSLYPLATVVLARLVLKERISLVQFLGIGLAIAAAILLGLA